MRLASALQLTLSLVLVPLTASAQIVPPKPGVEMPQAYYDRISHDPKAFQFRNAWIQNAARARKARDEVMELTRGGLTRTAVPVDLQQRSMVAGTVKVPVVMIKYSNTGADPYPASTLAARLFTDPAGTVTELYDEMSYGNLDLTGDVWGWVTASNVDTYYEGGCNGLCMSSRTGQLIKEAIQGVDGTVDFGQYDNDGPDGFPNSGDDDGIVDLIAIVHPEVGGECGTTNIWSHRWVVGAWPQFGGNFQPWSTNDNSTNGGKIKIHDYTIQPAKGSGGGCGSGTIEIGVFAHEFGHAFGLPDLYDTDGGGQGIGEHGLMGSGNWQEPSNPTHMCAWSKAQLGWASPTEVGPSGDVYSIPNVELNPVVYQLNIMEEKFGRKALNPIDGSWSLHCGIGNGAANARNWAAGKGYGNNWDESIRRGFSYDGRTPVTLQYDVSWDTEATYDFGYVMIDVNGTEKTLATYDGLSSANGVTIDLTPVLSRSAAASYQLIFRFTSDVGYSDEDGDYNSGSGGPFKIDNVHVTGGGENYFSDFEQHEDGWCYDFEKNPNREFFLVENRNKTGAKFNQFAHAQGLLVWHIEQNVADGFSVNTGGTGVTTNLRPAGVTLETADGLNQLLLGFNRGDAGDSFPGSTNNTLFDGNTVPNSNSYNDFATNVVVSGISSAAPTMNATMQAGRFAPTVTSITPNSGENNGVVSIDDLMGTFLYKGGTFVLRRGAEVHAASEVEWVGKNKVSGEIDLAGVAPGSYQVVWTGPDGQQAVLADGFTVDGVATGIEAPPVLSNRLDQNVPNPFNPTTTITYSIRDAGHVTLRIYNASGQLVRTLVNETQTPRSGGYSVVWNGTNNVGNSVASGVYMYKLTTANGFADTRKLILLK